ncbi:hypothetical protein BHU72_01285 [Desulfuribacillus stibiiarsenatis]|uniref:Uncharacterized protein n=1 Tax=Desulfuribacillus stibiiarsenatis TaxID=1390249 RepID=A0A1E5LAA4_9FIRM|nr:hypothetical protein [Desulfuribacillus stibiiarsenatis]OEH86923.1 hypothetical protein BHU72_01285 [Desulfuribacillus stibiiarsenatis]
MASLWWLIFAVVVWGITIALVKWENFKRHWIAGIIGMIAVIIIDSPLSKGGIYLFHQPMIQVFNLPLFYIIGLYAGGVFIVHFYPWGNPIKGLLFLILADFIFLSFEVFMDYIGLFEHVHWKFLYSFFINITGFLLTLYFYIIVQHLLGNKSYSI